MRVGLEGRRGASLIASGFPRAIHYVRMKRKFNLHDGFRPSALTGRDYAFNNLT